MKSMFVASLNCSLCLKAKLLVEFNIVVFTKQTNNITLLPPAFVFQNLDYNFS